MQLTLLNNLTLPFIGEISLTGSILFLFFICLICIVAFEFVNGFHDTANAVATEDKESAVKKLVNGVDFDFKYVNESSTIDGIANFIVSNATDILCVVKHHHNIIYRIFNRSKVNKVVNRSLRAILVLHE